MDFTKLDFTKLDAVETNAEPLVSPLPLTNSMREDVAVKIFAREDLLANAPEQYDGYFQVPGVIA